MSWKKVKLGDILTESKIISENPNPDRRITVRLKVLGVEKRGLENEVEGATKQYIRKAGQFIYGKQNFHKGAFGIIPPELDGFESSSDLPAFDVHKSCLPEFIFYFFKQGNFYLELSKIASGVATQRINTTQLFELELLLPDVKTQRQLISNIQLLEKNGAELSTELTHQLTLVKKLSQQLLQDAVQGKLVEQDKSRKLSGEPASELLKKIKAEKQKLIAEKKLKKEKELPPIKPSDIPFEIPENWVWCRLGKICTKIGSGSTPKGSNYSEKGIAFFRSQNIYNSGLVYDDIKYITDEVHKQMNGTTVIANDILLNITGGSMGRCALVPEDFEEGNVSQHVCIIRPIEINNRFFHSIVLSPFFQTFIFSSTTGAGREGLPKYNLEQFVIPLPPLSEQNRIVQKLDELMQYCNKLEASIKQSQQQNEKLLQQVLREALRPKNSKLNQENLNIAAEPLTEYKKGKVIELPEQQEKEKSHFVKRKVLAAYIINQSLDDQQFGDVKFEKLLHLSDYFAIKRNLGQKYYQKVAGPLDNAFTFPFFEQIEKEKWFNRNKVGRQFKFSKASNHPKSLNTYGYFSDEELAKVQRLIDYFKKTDYEKPEIISTLYAVWNNRLIKQQPITDALLKQDFLDWDENKAKYKDRLDSALAWMRTEGLIPDGWGELIEKPKTKKKN